MFPGPLQLSLARRATRETCRMYPRRPTPVGTVKAQQVYSTYMTDSRESVTMYGMPKAKGNGAFGNPIPIAAHDLTDALRTAISALSVMRQAATSTVTRACRR